MKFSHLPSWIVASSLASPFFADADGLRGVSTSTPGSSAADNDARRGLAPAKASECVIQVAILEMIEEGNDLEEVQFECEMDPADANGEAGQNRRIAGSHAQMKILKKMFEDQQIVPGVSKLEFGGVGIAMAGSDLILGAGVDPKAHVTKAKHESKGERRGKISPGRRLASNPVTGDKPTLVVRVTDVNGLARPELAPQVGDDIFGTLGDPVNLKSQLYDCSMGKLNVVAGDMGRASPPVNYAAPGVIDVTIGIDITTGATRAGVRNAVTSAAQAQLGFNLPGPYQQVIYVLEGCYGDECGWAAYAYIDSWMSVYQDVYYKQTGTLVHELGHNFNLAHSGGLDGQEYTDHTGMMGNPLYSDDRGKMCYNAAKNWQLGWYDDRKLLVEPLSQGSDWSQSVTLVGIADYLNNPSQHPVVAKLETGTPADYFVGFNRAVGVNADNVEADDLVTIVQIDSNNGEGYSQSYLRGYIGQGQSFTLNGFGGSAKNIVIEVVNIDIASSPGMAQVLFRTDQAPTASPTPNGLCDGQPGTRRAQVNLLTDSYPAETSWTLVNTCTGATEKSSANDLSTPYTGQNTNYMDQWCVPEAQYTFTINDAYGDGICCSYGSGSYNVVYGSDVVASGGQFAGSETSDPFGSCDTTLNPTPLPTKQPTPLPTKQPTPLPTKQPTPTPTNQLTPDPTNQPTPNPTNQPTPPTPSCTVCSDNPTPWMTSNGKTCESAPALIQTKCNNSGAWVANSYCQQTCFEAGRGYAGINCCADCTVCSDDPTPWMTSNGKTCESAPGVIQTKCKDSDPWVANNYCQQTCFEAGRGYDGVNCCAL